MNTVSRCRALLCKRPLLVALLLYSVLFLFHCLNLWVLSWFRIASSYVLVQAMAIDVLIEIPSSMGLSQALSEGIAPFCSQFLIFLLLYLATRFLRTRERVFLVVLVIAFVILLFLSIPLFPERAFYR
jgi:hypothetical protein